MKKTALFLLFLIAYQQGIACSAFLLQTKDNLYVGFNENWKTMPGMVVVNQRSVKKYALSWNYLSSTHPLPSNTKKWTSKYGSVCFSLMGADLPCYGMNEKGLYLVELFLDKTYSIAEKGKPNMFWAQWIQYQLDNYKDVDELIGHLEQAPVIDWWPKFPGSHFFIADSSGKTAVVELIAGRFKIYTAENMPVKLLCNNPYAQDLQTVKRYEGFGGTETFDLTKNDWDDRFIKAATMLNNFTSLPNQDALNYSWSILDGVRPGEWQMVADMKKKKFYFRSDIATGIKEIDLSQIDFSKKAAISYRDIHIKSAGDISADFYPLTSVINKNYTEKGFVIAYDNKDFPASQDFRNIIHHMDQYFTATYK